MELPEGNLAYDCTQGQTLGRGYVWSESELESALTGKIRDRVYDAEGRALLQEIAASVMDTGFDTSRLEPVLESGERLLEWQVGEAIAEVYLEAHRTCLFPWLRSWDNRRPGSSLPGADLVGIVVTDGQERFAFGEVKTSSESNYPPRVMYGEHGLKRQIEDLLGQVTIRNMLVRYLMMRTANQPWVESGKRAFSRYINDQAHVLLVGVLVRDVEPHQDDLRARVNETSGLRSGSTQLELLGLYLPVGSLAQVVHRLVALQEGGEG